MRTPILTTKLFFPTPPPHLVDRPRLMKRLHQGLTRKLILISAPAGFGKTTVVSEWVHKLHVTERDNRTGSAFAWLSLDEGDNDPTRFLTYVIAALNRIEGLEAPVGQGALSMLQSPQPPPTETILASLINEIANLPGRFILVLDDYHVIESSQVHEVLATLLERMPPQMTLVMATRDDPHQPLARLRARGQLTELRAADLRFTPAEAAEFLNQVMNLDLSAEDVNALEARTEGWIAGLQLAAISMQGRKDASSLVRSFTGSHRFVLDYLVEEVLDQQSEDVQSFLLQTAILDRMTGSLCDALTGQDHGQATLELLDRANLFIVRLDQERRWYRYHQLFSDLLRRRLKQTQAEEVPVLHRKASDWYERNGFDDEAVEHALHGSDWERAGRLIEDRLDVLWQRGEHTRLRQWLAALPGELLASTPQLGIFHGWYLFANGQQDEGERSLDLAEQAMEAVSGAGGGVPNQSSGRQWEQLRGRVAAIRAAMGSYRGDVPAIIEHSRQALAHLPEQDVGMRTTAAIALGNAYGFMGDMPAAYQARWRAVQASKAAGNTYFSLVAHLEVAITLREQGQLQRTVEICQQQLQLAGESGLSQTPVAGCLSAIWGEALAEQGGLEQGRRQAEQGADLATGGDRAMLGWSYLCLMRVLLSAGDLAAAQEAVHRLDQVARQSDLPAWTTTQMAAWQARLWLAQGWLSAASQWARERGLLPNGEPEPAPNLDYFTLVEHMMLARILIAQERWDKATRRLQPMLEAAEAGDRTTRVIEILNLQALAFQAEGDTSRALDALQRALMLAQPAGFFRTFVDEGPPMARLLQEALARGVEPDYARRLLAAFPSAVPGRTGPSQGQLPTSELVEPLSQREIEVVQLIAQGLTNQEIAARLYLSLHTVKVHTRNIYGKLDVHSRTQAVARARALGLLPIP